MPASPEWPAERTERLRTLWDEGMPITAIGVILHVSRNAVVGKVGRLDLPRRPSPILAAGSGRRPYRRKPNLGPPRPKPLPLPPLASVVAATVPARSRAPVVEKVEARPISRETPIPQHPGRGECAFIFGDRPHYRACGQPCVLNARGLPSPWCADHHRACTAGVPALRREAA
jgi:hypothetical protein